MGTTTSVDTETVNGVESKVIEFANLQRNLLNPFPGDRAAGAGRQEHVPRQGRLHHGRLSQVSTAVAHRSAGNDLSDFIYRLEHG